jgi:hypothetical protein
MCYVIGLYADNLILTDGFSRSKSFMILVVPGDIFIRPDFLHHLIPGMSSGKNYQLFFFQYTTQQKEGGTEVSKYSDYRIFRISYMFSVHYELRASVLRAYDVPLTVTPGSTIRKDMEAAILKNFCACQNLVSVQLSTGHSPPWLPLGIEDDIYNVILTSSYSMQRYLREMTMRDYYFYYRRKITFLRMTQAILFEHIDTNASKLVLGKHYGTFWLSSEVNSYNINYGFKTIQGIHRGSLYPTATIYFNFLTCHGLKKIVSARYFVDPFDSYLWFFTLSTILTVSLILIFADTVFNGKQVFLNSEMYFYSLSVVLENGFGSLRLQSQNDRLWSLSYFILAIISAVIGNYYKAIFTMDIAAPLQERITVEKLSELRNWSITTLPFPYHLASKRPPWTNPGFARELGLTGRAGTSSGIKFNKFRSHISFSYFSPLGEEMYHERDNHPNKSSSEINELLSLVDAAVLHLSSEEALNYISACDKSAFVGTPEQVETFQKFSQSDRPLGMGKDRFFPRTYFWSIGNRVGELVQRRMASILDSGVYRFWENIFNMRTRDELEPLVKRATTADKQNLETPLGYFFPVYLACISLSVAIFLFEAIIFKLLAIRKRLKLTNSKCTLNLLSFIRYLILRLLRCLGRVG